MLISHFHLKAFARAYKELKRLLLLVARLQHFNGI